MSLGMASITPVIYSFWKANGLSSGDIVCLKVALLASIIVCELPSGVIADFLGRRLSLLIAGGFLVSGEAFYLVGTGFAAFLIGEVCIAIGVSLVTGTDQAALFESLRNSGRCQDFGRYFGWLRASELLLSAGITMFAGHIFAAWDRLPFLTALSFFCVLPLLSAWLHVPTKDSQLPEPGRKKGWSVEHFPRRRETLALLAFTAFAFGLGPILKTFSQAFLSMHEVPVSQFGYAPALGLLMGAIVGVLAHRFGLFLGQRSTLVVIAVVYVITLSCLAFGGAWVGQAGIVVFLANEVMATITLSRLLQEEISDPVRATVMSVAGMGSRACSLLLLCFFSNDGHENVSIAFTLTTLVTIAVFTCLFWLRFSNRHSQGTKV